MSWRELHCWALNCDVCGDGWPGGQPHFDKQDDACRYALEAGWVVTILRAVCPDCLSPEACAVAGHSWGAWIPVGVSPIDDPAAEIERLRECRECGAAEWDPPADVESRAVA